MKMKAFWDTALQSLIEVHLRFRCHTNDGGRMHLWNIGLLVLDYTAPYFSRLLFENSGVLQWPKYFLWHLVKSTALCSGMRMENDIQYKTHSRTGCTPGRSLSLYIQSMNFCIQLAQPWSICNYYDTALSQKNSFIHFPFDTNLEHRAAFRVSVITHTIRQTAGLLWTNDQPVAETSTHTWQHNI
jgi:hypothetical protein